MNAGVNVSAIFNVSVVPEIVTDEPVPLSVHCEFCCINVLPGAIVDEGVVPPSVSSASEFAARLYVTEQALTVEVDVPISIVALEKSDAPTSSVNVAVKVWTLPRVF